MAGRFPRIACCVIGCRRGSTAFPPGQEIICADHWRTVRKDTKRRKRLADKAVRKWEAIEDASPVGLTVDEIRVAQRAERIACLAWRRAKAEANARAVGL